MGTSVPAWILAVSVAVIALVFLLTYLTTQKKP